MIGSDATRLYKTLLAAPLAWAIAFVGFPALLVVCASFLDMQTILEFLRSHPAPPRLQATSYASLLTDPLYRHAIVSSITLAATCTVLTSAIGLPLALAIAKSPSRWRPILLFLVALPFWTSFLVRVYSWMTVLNDAGLLNGILMSSGLIRSPVHFLNSAFAVHLGIAYTYLPFMVFPAYAALEQEERDLGEAAADLGARPASQLLQVTLPLAGPGIMVGAALVFVPALGEYVIPELLGPSDLLTLGRMIWIDTFRNQNWPEAAALAVTFAGTIALLARIAGRSKAMADA